MLLFSSGRQAERKLICIGRHILSVGAFSHIATTMNSTWTIKESDMQPRWGGEVNRPMCVCVRQRASAHSLSLFSISSFNMFRGPSFQWIVICRHCVTGDFVVDESVVMNGNQLVVGWACARGPYISGNTLHRLRQLLRLITGWRREGDGEDFVVARASLRSTQKNNRKFPLESFQPVDFHRWRVLLLFGRGKVGECAVSLGLHLANSNQSVYRLTFSWK